MKVEEGEITKRTKEGEGEEEITKHPSMKVSSGLLSHSDSKTSSSSPQPTTLIHSFARRSSAPFSGSSISDIFVSLIFTTSSSDPLKQTSSSTPQSPPHPNLHKMVVRSLISVVVWSFGFLIWNIVYSECKGQLPQWLLMTGEENQDNTGW